MERPQSPLTYTPDEDLPPPCIVQPSSFLLPSLVQPPSEDSKVLYESLQCDLDGVIADIRSIRMRVLRLEKEKKEEASRPYMSSFLTTTTITFAFFVLLSYMSA